MMRDSKKGKSMHSVSVCPCLRETVSAHTFCMCLHCFDMLSCPDLRMTTASSSSWGGHLLYRPEWLLGSVMIRMYFDIYTLPKIANNCIHFATSTVLHSLMKVTPCSHWKLYQSMRWPVLVYHTIADYRDSCASVVPPLSSELTDEELSKQEQEDKAEERIV